MEEHVEHCGLIMASRLFDPVQFLSLFEKQMKNRVNPAFDL